MLSLDVVGIVSSYLVCGLAKAAAKPELVFSFTSQPNSVSPSTTIAQLDFSSTLSGALTMFSLGVVGIVSSYLVCGVAKAAAKPELLLSVSSQSNTLPNKL